ncbi:hypothetical protein ACVNS2_10610 [Paenibacillus caseinilyticus]|uniref:Uncharacterized protein n=1 Tax=Paenibacillus mucilaginosus K02 TaxID=997761 RepID=I0BFE9_9BACL|nr:hypothetical protein [Paenibacillus mucilaginosus]AFH61096.1 hypothetical protein B2K_10230 [Paenibacillus mucilaginosus K02]
MKRLSLALASALLISSVGGAAIAAPESTSLTTVETTSETAVDSALRKNLTDLGVPKETQDKLIAKYKRGEKWDSMKQSEIDKLGKEFFTVTGTEGAKRHVFPDGSVFMIKVGPGVPAKSPDGEQQGIQGADVSDAVSTQSAS